MLLLKTMHGSCMAARSSSLVHVAMSQNSEQQESVDMFEMHDQSVSKLPEGARDATRAPGLTTKSKDAFRGSWHRY